MARNKLLAKYGLTVESYALKLDLQDGKCYICRKPPKEDKKGNFRNLAVDHNHSTGSTRGLLCFSCNRILVSKIDRMYSKNPQEVCYNLHRYVSEFDFTRAVKLEKPKRKKITKCSRTSKPSSG